MNSEQCEDRSTSNARQSFPTHTQRDIPPNANRQKSVILPVAQRPNDPIGDSLIDILDGEDDGKQFIPSGRQTGEIWKSQVIRVYFQNVNGLRLYEDGTDILDAFFHMEHIRADIFGFVETKLDCRSQLVQATLHKQKRKVWRHCKLVSSSSSLPWHSSTKPGGVLLGVTGPLVGRVQKRIDDDLGRWTGLELLGRDGRSLVILCAYQVSQRGSSNYGQFTAHAQQMALLRLRGVSSPNPRKQFITDLTRLLSQYVQDKSDIILMGDFNETIGMSIDGMAQVINECGLTDVQAFKHGLETEQSTYARGPNRVDYFLISDRLLQHVLRQGCEEFNARIFSDHRGLFMDMSYPGFFDRAPNILAAPSCRNLIYDCPRHVRRYLQYMDKYIKDHNLIERAHSMAQDDRDDKSAETFDRDFTIGLLAADRCCKSFKRSPWSPELHIAMTTRHIYQRQLSSLLTGHDMNTVINKLQDQLPKPISISNVLSVTQKQLRSAQSECRKVVRNARDLAKSQQETRIVAKQLANPDCDPDAVAKVIRNRDAYRELWKRIPSSRMKVSGGISTIRVPKDMGADPKDPATEFRTVVDPSEMEDLLLTRNRNHFKQAQGTPLASDRVSATFGWGGDSSAADRLLRGEFDTLEVTADQYAQAILNECRRLNDEIDPTITLEEFQKAYLKWRVGTSTSPSGRHLSHLHALFQPVGTEHDSPEQRQFFRDVKDLLWFTHHACVHYATRYGYCFDRWRQVVNTMIEKEPGNPALHRLRVIHLYENDYNLLLGTKYRQVIHLCQDNSQLNPGCYGGLANKQSTDPIFLEVMQYDYAMLTRWDTIKFANDAGSCYDRIVVSPSNIMARSRGLHSNIAKIHGHMLEHAVYRIKTQLGISAQGYSHTTDSPVYGTGQGSRSSPPTWNINGSLYFDVFDKHCHGAEYVDMESLLQLRLGMAGYVDDNSVQVTSHPAQRDSLIFRATADAQLWSDILWASGGVLEHDKCSYHYLRTDFDRNGAPILRAGKHGDPIIIKDSNGRETRLTQLSVYTPYKTLGTYQCPGSAQRQQTEELVKKAQSLIRTLATSSCQGQAAWLFYSAVFCKSVGYPLAVSRLSDQQIRKIQGPMTPVILNRLGYERRLSHALTFGPRRFGGLGLPHLQSIQDSSHINLMVRHLRTPGQPGTLAKINLNRLQYTAGVSFHIFERPKAHLPHLEGTWLLHFRTLLANLDATMIVANTTIVPIQRENDEYIMDRVLTSRKFTDREIRSVNYCRLYFKSICISDICSACGTRLEEGVASGRLTTSQSLSVLQDPYQERPGPLAWGAWRKMLRLFSSKDGELHVPLGKWLYSATQLRRRWQFVYSPGSCQLFQRQPAGYCQLQRVRVRIYSLREHADTKEIPEDCVPIYTETIADGVRIGQHGGISQRTETPSLASLTFQEYLDFQHDHERSPLLRFNTFGKDIHDVIDDLREMDDIILVSDASVDNKCGTFGWVLCNKVGKRLAQGSGPVFGDNPSSYRAEISGSRAGLLFICHAHVYCERPIPEGCLHIYCDNIGYVNKTASMQEHSLAPLACCLDSDWDLLISVNQLLSLFPMAPKVTHIRGHQDRTCDYDSLSLPAQLNVDADALARDEMANFGRRLPEVPLDPVSCVLVSIGGCTITSDVESAVRNQRFLPKLREYLCRRFQWSKQTFNSIAWDDFSIAYSKYPRSRKFFMQFGWKKLPCGGRLHARESRFDDRCPCCFCPEETDDHLLQCNHVERKSWRKSFLLGLEKKLSSFLDPELLVMIRLGLTSYFQNSPGALQAYFPDPGGCVPRDPCHSMHRLADESSTGTRVSVQAVRQVDLVSEGQTFDEANGEQIHRELGGSQYPFPLAQPSDTSSTYGDASETPGFLETSRVSDASTDSAFSMATHTEDDGDYDPDDSDWTEDNTVVFHSTNIYILLRQAQDAIGWDHFIRGKCSRQWNEVQFKYAVRHNLVDKSKNWLNWLIKYMANQVFNLWSLRNRRRHGTDRQTQHQARLEQARRDVAALYVLQSRVLVQDRDLFCNSLDEHLTHSLSHLKNWLAINKPLILQSVRTAKAQSKLHTHPIRRFFAPNGKVRSSKTTGSIGIQVHKTTKPSLMTRFFPRILRHASGPRRQSRRDDRDKSRPSQRYLFDFFPNHPG